MGSVTHGRQDWNPHLFCDHQINQDPDPSQHLPTLVSLDGHR